MSQVCRVVPLPVRNPNLREALFTLVDRVHNLVDVNNTQQQRGRNSTSRGVLLVFSICALADFVWALVDKRSLAEAVISAILGLFGTAIYLLIDRAAEKNDPDDPNWPQRMVP